MAPLVNQRAQRRQEDLQRRGLTETDIVADVMFKMLQEVNSSLKFGLISMCKVVEVQSKFNLPAVFLP